ncbi:MAG: hypothetical protein GC199_01115 [Alphaproteobacteria bacterium]|nr:hypothetical protein [Alphaproteobacteria bacterium]
MNEDDDLDPDIARLLARFVQGAGRIAWFGHIGEPLDAVTREEARALIDALGFPEIEVTPVANWRDAARAAEARDLDTLAFDAEEQLRAALTAEAIERHGETAFEVMSTVIAAETTATIRKAARIAAATWGLRDRDLVNAAAGAGALACHQAALVLLGGDGEEDHPFALKFRLYERGRWPIGVTGASFNLF